MILKSLRIMQISVDSLEEITPIHCACFPNSIMTKLGPDIIRRYYNWQFTGPHHFNKFGAYDGDRLIGYCISGISSTSLSGFIRKNIFPLAIHVIRNFHLIFTDRLMLSRMKMGFLILIKRPRKQHNPLRDFNPIKRQARILVVATDPKEQGRGAGRLLLENAEFLAYCDGYNQLGLTVHTDNYQAIGFYEHLGWQKKPDNEHWSGQMEKPISLESHCKDF